MQAKWLPNQPAHEDTLAAALWLEKSYWENMKNAVQAAIADAFNG